MEHLLSDVRLACRTLWKDRGFTATAVATLAVCLAANVAIFTIVDAVLLKPLPFAGAERLVRIFNKYPGAGVEVAANGVPDYFDRLRGMPAVEGLAMFRRNGMTMSGAGGEAERIQAMIVTPSFFRLIEVEPHRGRLFTDEHGEPGRERVVVVTYALWQRVFGGSDDAIGKSMRLGGQPYTVIGVLPDGFRFISGDLQLFVPAAFSAEERSDDARHSNNWQQFGRLGPGGTVPQAQAQLDAINAANDARFPQWREILRNARFSTEVVLFQENLVAESRSTLLLLWGGAAFVLLVGCVNVANLVLVRAIRRLRDMATRQALGASTWRLTRQSLAESMVLATAGGAAGVGLGWWALRAAPLLGFDRLPGGSAIAMDARVAIFTVAVVAVVGVAVGLIAPYASRRLNLAREVREEGRGGTQGRGARMMRRLLVTSQVALALVLLVGAGVLFASFQRVLHIDPGFRTDQVLTGTVSLPATRYAGDAELRAVTGRLLDEVRMLPGVAQAGLTTTLPFSGNDSDSVIVAEGYQMAPGESLVSPSRVVVTDGYFEAMGVTLKSGRLFTPADAEGRPLAIVIDEALARKFWPRDDAVGRRMFTPSSPDDIMKPPADDQMLTIVGVIAPMRLRGLIDAPGDRRVGAYYFPYRQQPARTLGLAVRTTQAPETMAAAVRRVVAGIDAELPLYGVRTLEEGLAESLTDRRTPMLLATGFAGVALFLAAIGIYGVLAYQVSQRRREIGIRMALGAQGAAIAGMVLKEGAAIVAAGSVGGLAGAYLMRRILQGQLYEVGAMDPSVIAVVTALLAAVAAAACLLPARRAARTDPAVALGE